MTRWDRIRPLLSLFVTTVIALERGSAAADATEAQANRYAATILRDKFGVPHIYGRTAVDVGYALGRAQCEDRREVLVQNLYAGAGRSAELLGASALESDKTTRTLRHLEAAERDWQTLSPELREYVAAFTEGINDWLAEHPDGMQLIKFAPFHVLAAQRQLAMRGALRIARQEGNATIDRPAAGVAPGNSNAWAVSGRKSASGKPLLLIDPHWPLGGPLQLYEARLHGGSLDVWGFLILGTPVVAIGSTSGVAWTLTAGGADATDAFALRLKPGDSSQYEWDGKWTRFDSRMESFVVRDRQGSREVAAEFHETLHGPVLVNERGESFAARLPGWGECRAMEQFWRMNHARSASEFRAAIALDQICYQNLVWATRDGDIGYVQLGQAPRRPPGYDWTRRVPGWTSATWSTERVPVSDLPAVENPPTDFLQNCNVAANVVTPGLTMLREQFGPGVLFGHYGQYRARGQRAADLLSQARSLDLDAARKIVFDTYCKPADLWVPVILQAFREAGEPEDVARGAKLLQDWNRHADRDSSGATLFRFWRLACDAMPTSKAGRDAFTVPNSPEVRADAMSALRAALNDLQQRYGRITVPWGEVKRLRRGDQEWPLSGDSLDQLGLDTLRATKAGPLDKDHKFIVNGGQSTTALVTWTGDRPDIHAVAGYGQSIQASSPHFADQAPLYSSEQLRPVPWSEADARKETSRVVDVGSE